MFWILFAVLANLFWGLVNVGDKYVIVNKISDPIVYMVWLTLYNVFLLGILPFVDFSVPPTGLLAWLALAAALFFGGSLLYARAVAREDITRLNVWWGLIPVFTLLLSWILLEERLSDGQLFAFVLLIAGLVSASLHVSGRLFRVSRALWLIVGACLLYAGYAVILRFVTQSVSPATAFLWISFFSTIFALLLFLQKKFRTVFFAPENKLHLALAGGLFLIALFDNIAMVFNIWAYSLGPAALVAATGGFQAIFVFILVIFITLKNPRLLREELDRRNLTLKIIALILMVAGIAVLNLT